MPDNYDPQTRSYTGIWSGGFKWAYSDNPAWVFYDIILAERFGLGDRIDASQVSESELYRIAQYCDQPVPDGAAARAWSRASPATFICSRGKRPGRY